MMCGTYTIDPYTGQMVNCPPLTNIDSLSHILDCNPSIAGIRKARRALRFIANNSNSPRETYSSMLLTFSKLLGGKGLPQAKLNVPMLIGHTKVYPDLYWENPGVVVEYNGYLHYGPGKGVRDDLRNNAYASRGLKVYALTNEHFASFEAFRRASEDIRRLLGIKARYESQEELSNGDDLFRHLLSPNHQNIWINLLGNGSVG